MQPCLLHHETRDRLPAQIAVLANDDFAWFARYGLAIQARNVLDDGTKQSKNLWYEETLPPDAVLYAIVMGRGDDALGALDSLFPERDPYLQAGGNVQGTLPLLRRPSGSGHRHERSGAGVGHRACRRRGTAAEG